MSEKQSILEFIETTLKSVEDIKEKILELENNIKKTEVEKPKLDVDEIVFEAVKRGFVTLDMVDEKYSKDTKFAEAAVKAKPENIKFVDKSLQDQWPEHYIEHYKPLLKENGLKLKDCPSSIQINKELCALAINQNFEAFKFVKNEEILNDRELVIELVDKNGLLLEFVSEELKKDFEVVITAVSNNNNAKEFISDEIKDKIISLFA